MEDEEGDGVPRAESLLAEEEECRGLQGPEEDDFHMVRDTSRTL